MSKSHSMFRPIPGATENAEALRKLSIQAIARRDIEFAAMSEEEQMLSLFAPHLSSSYGSRHREATPKEEVARKLLLETFGPKFTARVLADPSLRNCLGLKPLEKTGNPCGSKG